MFLNEGVQDSDSRFAKRFPKEFPKFPSNAVFM
jgi:hypothetical protein